MQTSLLSKPVNFFLLILVFFCSAVSNAQMRITEFMYSGTNGEFIEFTNTGNAAIDMTGWSFDDGNRSPGSHNLSGFGVVQPGESVLVTETSPVATFRSAWGLCNEIKVVGGYTNNNLGRADEINLYNTSQVLVDRLTYDDQGSGGGPRTQNKSAWVKAAGLGANLPAQWTLSAVNDAEGSFVSSGGDIGSPGKSTRATVSFNPCAIANGAPQISINTFATSNLLDGGISTSPSGSFAISGVINDPTDPAALLGVFFTVSDDITSANSLVLSALSSNPSVVSLSNIIISGTGAVRNVKIIPQAVGYSNITIAVSDGTNTSNYLLVYAASDGQPANTRWHTGISDASDAIAIDSAYFITGDDEQNVLNIYKNDSSGLPVSSFNYTNALNLPDPAKPEVDVEGAARSNINTNRIFWMGSMSNGKDPFESKPNRNRLFATDLNGTGASTSFSLVGYGAIKTSLLAWGDGHQYNFTASAAAGVDSKTPAGFAAEGIAFAPDNTTLYIGLRAPLVPVTNRNKALIAPILQFETWFNNGSPAGNPVYGEPIELDLGGRGIRDLVRLPNGVYLIIAGSAGPVPDAAFYKWSGIAGQKPYFIQVANISLLNLEGAWPVQSNGQWSDSQIKVLADKGGDDLYNSGAEAKDLGENNHKKFNSTIVNNLDLQLLSVAITSPSGDTSFAIGEPITIEASVKGGLSRVEFYAGSGKVAEDVSAPFSLTAQDVDEGIYLVTARGFNAEGDSIISDTIRVTVTGCTASGTISAEGFTNIPGSGLISLGSSSKYPSEPDVTAQLNKFEYGPNFGENYGARVRGYICAPATGNYVFYLSSDDQSQLFLSTNDDPQNIRRIAYLDQKVAFRNWFANASQHSVPVYMVKGHKYYVESIHKQGTGADHFSVGWVLPNGFFQAPIPGNQLSPFQQPQSAQAAVLDFASEMRSAQSVIKAAGIEVFPNPSNSIFNLIINGGNQETVSVKVMNVTGQLLEILRIPVNKVYKFGDRYRPGVYILEGIVAGKIFRNKIVKQ